MSNGYCLHCEHYRQALLEIRRRTNNSLSRQIAEAALSGDVKPSKAEHALWIRAIVESGGRMVETRRLYEEWMGERFTGDIQRGGSDCAVDTGNNN